MYMSDNHECHINKYCHMKYYKDINKALTELKLAEPTFQNDLNQRYFPERVYTPFGKYELKYVYNNRII